MEAIEKGLVPEELLSAATSFSGGMGSGCLCGAIAGSQIVLGYVLGRSNARAAAKKFIEEFKKKYSDVDFNITLGAESESKAKDDILVDVEAAPDVFAFADDQINELVKAGALQPVQATYTFDVANENVAASVEAASVDGTLYAYPMTADNGYFMFYDSSVFTEDDVQSLDAMIEAAKKANKKIAMNVSDGMYTHSSRAQDLTLHLTMTDLQIHVLGIRQAVQT